MLHFFSWFFSEIICSSPSSSSQHIFALRRFFLNYRILKTRRRNVEKIPSDFAALLSFIHSHSLFLHSSPRPPLSPFILLFFFFFFYWLSSLAHFLWVGGTYPLLVGDSLADQVLCSLCCSLGTCDGNLPVPSSRDELAFLGDLDPGPRQLLVLY